MDVDSAQYASISREMAETGEYLQVKHRGEDYLDKPPLLFWVTSVFFQLFGFHNWVFKIGSFLFTLLGVYSTYRLGKLLYRKEIGLMAALILYTCQAFFLFNNDVRTDTILTGTVVFSIWLFMEWLSSKKWKWLIGAGVGMGLAMLTKGPIGLIIPAMAISGYFIGKGSWKSFFRWQYLVLLLVVGLMLAPMLYGLYQQFDLHPEKVTKMVSPDGLKPVEGVSGVKFYLWTQSFGRISGENVWKDTSGPFFFVHNFLWSFLPWSLFFLLALWARIKETVSQFKQKAKLPELLTLLGFILPFIALSKSSYKLPHYIFPLYPFAAILIGWWWLEYLPKAKSKIWSKMAYIIQLLVALVSFSLIGVIYFLFFEDIPWYHVLVSLCLGALSIYYLINYKKIKHQFLKGVVLVSITVNFVMNGWFYPNILKFQAGSLMVDSVLEHKVPIDNLYLKGYYSFSFHYYLPGEMKMIQNDVLSERMNDSGLVYLVVPEPELELLSTGYKTTVIDVVKHHPVTRLSLNFLLKEKREESLNPLYLIKVEKL